ncbi:MAG: DUF4398 domain-containing protein [Deltaproteobacteria bacterium]|nr:DUF4398 domain-containing protein [Deltaproteobacteria bacterium]MBT6436078.1 DUF4398 domain-containing protein [Deltaproteobacteria bacterium]MBT6488368.1 DUF4398 domain-containing protein [Deltaproteobacteria bacterium]
MIGLLLSLTLLVITGCGPVVSGVRILKADIALGEAQTAGAKETAVYEYTAAKVYLDKAREEHGYSDFWGARVYADKALKFARKAKKRAEVENRVGPQSDSSAVKIVPIPQNEAVSP